MSGIRFNFEGTSLSGVGKMSEPKLYGKIGYMGEGTMYEEKFSTEAEALAYVLGARQMALAADLDEDFVAGTDKEPAADDPEGTRSDK